MNDPAKPIRQGALSDELRPYVDRSEAEQIDRTGEWLEADRPQPRAEFGADLRARLAPRAVARGTWEPRRLGLLVALFVGSGFALMALAAVGLAGIGPLA